MGSYALRRPAAGADGRPVLCRSRGVMRGERAPAEAQRVAAPLGDTLGDDATPSARERPADGGRDATGEPPWRQSGEAARAGDAARFEALKGCTRDVWSQELRCSTASRHVAAGRQQRKHTTSIVTLGLAAGERGVAVAERGVAATDVSPPGERGVATAEGGPAESLPVRQGSEERSSMATSDGERGGGFDCIRVRSGTCAARAEATREGGSRKCGWASCRAMGDLLCIGDGESPREPPGEPGEPGDCQHQPARLVGAAFGVRSTGSADCTSRTSAGAAEAVGPGRGRVCGPFSGGVCSSRGCTPVPMLLRNGVAMRERSSFGGAAFSAGDGTSASFGSLGGAGSAGGQRRPPETL